jgi:hypothetical protein
MHDLQNIALYGKGKGKGKAIPLQALGDPGGWFHCTDLL